MIRIDAHQHFWKYDPQTLPWISEEMEILQKNYLPPDLKTELDQSGIDGCVAVQAAQSEEETRFLLRLADEYHFIQGVVGWVDLRDYNVKSRLAHFARHPKMKGVRHIVQDEQDDMFLLDPDFMRGVRLLPELDLTYDILIYERHLPVALQFVSFLSDCRMVVDHLAKPVISQKKMSPWQENIRSLGQYPQVYCKLSGMVTEAQPDRWKVDDFTAYLDVVFEAFGTEKLMFGSDWPVCKLAAEYQQVVEVLNRYMEQFTEEEKRRVYGQNAVDFYNLDV